MPFLLALVLITPLVVLLLMPFTLVQRYRTGSARRRAKVWLATLNIVVACVSILLFTVAAFVTSFWIPTALLGGVGGLATGLVLGQIGLASSRWEATSRHLHVTQNRWLVLAMTLIVVARLLYGCWRAWQAWAIGGEHGSWLAQAGVPGSLAAGGVVLGYQAAFWFGVRQRVIRHRR